MAQLPPSTVSIYGQSLTNQSEIGYSLPGFERFCSDSTQLGNGKAFRLNTTITGKQCAAMFELIDAMQQDSICVEEVKDVGFKYRARFMLNGAGVTHDVYLSSSDLQFIMVDGVVYNRCKPLYKSLSSLVPKNFRCGLRFIDYYSHCCGAKGKQLPRRRSRVASALDDRRTVSANGTGRGHPAPRDETLIRVRFRSSIGTHRHQAVS